MDTLPPDWPPISSQLMHFYKIWQSLRDGPDVPYRHQLSLRHIKSLASWLVILDIPSPGRLKVKVSGSNVDAVFGKPLTKVNLKDVTTPEASKPIVAFHEALMTHPCGGYAHDVMTMENGKRLDARYLMLPLRNEDGGHSMCASLWDATAEGFAEPPVDHRTRMTHSELQYACHLDVGFGLPAFPAFESYLKSKEFPDDY